MYIKVYKFWVGLDKEPTFLDENSDFFLKKGYKTIQLLTDH